MITLFLVTTFIANNPGITAAFVATLLGFIVLMVTTYIKLIGQRLEKLEHTDHELVDEVEGLKVKVEKYEEHVGAGDKMFAQLMQRVERHMTEEEERVWDGITDLGKQLTEMHADNLRAHSTIVERLSKVEAKMPNGDLAKLTAMVQGLVDRKE